jgi:hypothetical protein
MSRKYTIRRVKFNLHIGNKDIYIAIILFQQENIKLRLQPQANTSEILLQDISYSLQHSSYSSQVACM